MKQAPIIPTSYSTFVNWSTYLLKHYAFWQRKIRRSLSTRLIWKRGASFTRKNRDQNIIHPVWTGAHKAKGNRRETEREERGDEGKEMICLGMPRGPASWIVGIIGAHRCQSLLTWPEYFRSLKGINHRNKFGFVRVKNFRDIFVGARTIEVNHRLRKSIDTDSLLQNVISFFNCLFIIISNS